MPSDPLTPPDRLALVAIARSKDPLALRYGPRAAYHVAEHDKTFAVELLSSFDYSVAAWVAHECLLWLCSEETFPFASLLPQHVEAVLDRLRPVKELNDHWEQEFLKKALSKHPKIVLEFFISRVEYASANEDWAFRPIPSGPFLHGSMGFLDHTDALIYLTNLFEWALQHDRDGLFMYRFGELIDGLCAPFDDRFVSFLDTWVESGGDERLTLVLPILREAQNDFVFKYEGFVLRLLRHAKSHGAEMVRDLKSTFFASAVGGTRMGTPGKPFQQDLDLRESADVVMKKLGRFEPAYDLYEALLKHAEEEINSQLREGIDIEESES